MITSPKWVSTKLPLIAGSYCLCGVQKVANLLQKFYFWGKNLILGVT
jgi:hypothetical protein